jgi:predicted MFS family arabinose efflux permease
MSLGWGALSGAAINIILAPWWQRRRGLAVSLAFNGATLGGVVVTPALIVLIGAIGFARAARVAAAVALLVLGAAGAVMRRGPAELELGPDGDPPSPSVARPSAAEPGRRRDALRTWRFWSVSAPFALGLAAQVGVLTHLVTMVTPVLGLGGAARAVSTATAAAVLGRLATGFVVDRVSRRLAAAVTLAVQIAGVLVLARGASPAAIYLGCALFGAGIGNLTSLPGLILAVEWPRERFAPLIALVVGINQFTFAFGPSLVGVLRDRTGSYAPALAACAALQALAAVLVLLGPTSPRRCAPRSCRATSP